MSGYTTKKEAGFKITQLFNFQMKSKRCKICGKEIRGWNIKVVEYNLSLHLRKHKEEKEKEKDEK